MKMMLLTAILAVFVGVPASAGWQGEIGTFRPAAALSFTAGMTEIHNSYGLALGGHVSLARFGFVRFPVIGAEGGFAYYCDPWADTVVPGAHDPCGNRHVGLLQFKGGVEFTLNRTAVRFMNDDYVSLEETTLVVTPTYVVAGPFRGSWGLSLGVARRWGKSRFRD